MVTFCPDPMLMLCHCHSFPDSFPDSPKMFDFLSV
jgi:hypothetical protein